MTFSMLRRRPLYAPVTGGGGGIMQYLTPSGYQGPGDISGLSTPLGWWGLRAFSAAYAALAISAPGTNPALDITDQADANALTVNILATGALDVATINAWVAAHSVSTIKVAKLYDQTVNNRHLAQATTGARPTLSLTGVYHLVFATNAKALSSSAITQARPFTLTIIGTRVDNASAGNATTIRNQNTGAGINYNITSGFAPALTGLVSSDNAVAFGTVVATHAVSSATASTINVDGITDTGGATNQDFAGDSLDITSGTSDTINVTEAGMWAGDKSASFAALNTNEHAFWAF